MYHTLLSYLFQVPTATAAETVTPAGPGAQTPVALPNPLGQGSTIITVINNIISFGLKVAAAIVPIIIVIGAFQMLTAAGNPEKFAKGQKTIVYAIIGLVVLAASKGIVSLVATILK